MAAVAEVHVARLQVDAADEHRHEHVLLVVLGDEVVDLLGHLGRRMALLRDDTEHVSRHSHEQRGGNTLTRHVAHAEVEFLLLHEEVVQVAADLLGRGHRSEQVNILALGERREDSRHHAHLDIAGHLQFVLERSLQGRRRLEFLHVIHQRGLHLAERMAQLSDLVDASVVGQVGFKVAGGDGLGLPGQLLQRHHLAVHDAPEDQQHQQETHQHDRQHGAAQPVETGEDVPLGADDGDAPAGRAERLVEDIARFPVDHELLHALLPALHGVSQGGPVGIGVLEGFREDGLVEQFRGVRMHEVGTALPDHDAVGIGIGLDGGDGLREPAQGQVHRDGSDIVVLLVPDGLAVGGDHIRGEDPLGVEVVVRLRPARSVQQFGLLIPVHVEIFILVISLLGGLDDTVLVEGIGREPPALLLEIVRLEGNGAAVEVRIVLQDATGIDEHRVGGVQMAGNQPVRIVRGHHHFVQDVRHTEHRALQGLGGTGNRFAAHRLARLGEQEAQRGDEDEGREQRDPHTKPGSEAAPEEIGDLVE